MRTERPKWNASSKIITSVVAWEARGGINVIEWDWKSVSVVTEAFSVDADFEICWGKAAVTSGPDKRRSEVRHQVN